MSRFCPVAVTAAVFDRPGLVPPFPTRSDVEAWAAGCSLSARSRKMADTQTLLLSRACSLLFERNPGLNLHELPCTVAVGPARTDREALQAWSERLVTGEAWPMVSPAAAIGLLPNTPLSWMSIQLGLHGPGSVWSGWSSAGFHALASGILNVRQGSSPALVAAADAPLNYFVIDSRRRAGLPDLVAPVELGAALLLGDSGPVEIACLQAYPRGTPHSELFADLARRTGLIPAALEAACLHHPEFPMPPEGVVTGFFVAAAVFFFHHESLPLLTVIAVDIDETPRALVLRRRGS